MEEADCLKQKRAILEYWTLVEFFSPYLLDNYLHNKQQNQRVFVDVPAILPWSEKKVLDENDPASAFAKGYHLYLGLFSTEETADRARHVFHDKPSIWQSVDWQQCMSPGTLTCFARLTLTVFGTPLLSTLSLSTLPWAHGCLLNNNKDALTMEAYWKDVQRLLVDLREEFAKTLPSQLVRMPKESACTLDHKALCALVEFLFRWAGFTPKYYPIALIEPLNHEEGKTFKEPQIASERDVPILNSFYILDLERAAASLESQKGTPLDLYLVGKNDCRVDLEDENGKAAILEALKPSKLPKGRWPAIESKQLALMQQFAVNQALNSLEDHKLFSVNGPPGTGKTTLLREIVADNMVARAVVLAQFKRAEDAFIGKRVMGFGDCDPIFVSEFHPALAGFEMLVVSSNNTAVRNLSHELPLRRQLDSSYVNASYLEPVVCKLLKDSWGLISAALGNRENCRHLVETIFIRRTEQEGEMRIWEWAQKYTGLSFAQARDQFISLLNQHKVLQGNLESLATLHEEVAGGKLDALLETALQEHMDAEENVERLEKELSLLQKEEAEMQERHDLLERKAKLWEKERPNIIHRLFIEKKWSEWSEQSSKYTLQQIEAVEEILKYKERSRELCKMQEKLHIAIKAKEAEIFGLSLCVKERKEDYEKLKNAYPGICLPEGPHALEDPEIQKQSYYQCPALNRTRSELFLAAMALHEAWLAETLRPKGGFRGNLMAISNVLQGKNPTTADDTRLAWQSVFLIIPLISSTFASVGRLFRYLEPQSLGWVFIDEAGQALPQSAVGAIWRAKKVLSIGDPFQIEPISTAPHEIVDGMAKHRLKDHCLSWAPSQISVQNLMDAAAKYVSKRYVREVPHWLGAPLRVHRRCLEPMFSIANEIAYDNSMVLATSLEPACPLPPSCWYDVKGPVSGRQYVPSQGIELVNKLTIVLSAMTSPDIFVISPFREVVLQIKQLCLQNKPLKALFESRFDTVSFLSWIKDSIGTVHTFQGKQASAVFFVLGADQATLGTMEWAARKPNLLNVAVTRSCHRFYIVGDYDLWRQWPYFEVAAQKLERISTATQA